MFFEHSLKEVDFIDAGADFGVNWFYQRSFEQKL